MAGAIEKLLLFLGIGAVLFLAVLYIDPFHHWANEREAMRGRDIDNIAAQMIQGIQKNTAMPEFYKPPRKKPPEVPRQLQQLGTATGGCALETPSCHITNSSCIDFNMFASDNTTFPSDPKFGSIQRSGYTVMKTAPDEVTVVSCFSEKNQMLKVTRKISGNIYAQK